MATLYIDADQMNAHKYYVCFRDVINKYTPDEFGRLSLQAMADFSISPLIKNTAVSVIPHSDKATEFVDELLQQFKRFIADTLVLSQDEWRLSQMFYANTSASNANSRLSGDRPRPMTFKQHKLILSILPND